MKKHLPQSSIIRHTVFLCLLLVTIAAGGAASDGGVKADQDQKKPAAPATQPCDALAQQPMAQTAVSAEEIKEARILLDAHGYWVVMDEPAPEVSLRHALTAFQKIEGRPRTGVLTQAELVALRAARLPTARETGYPHIEVDLARQVLFIVECGDTALRILPISSGSGQLFTAGGVTRRAVTPVGRFQIKRKVAGWRKSPLGLLHYPNYFYGGVAIHGNPSVPPTPMSHGCVRIPMFASKEFSKLAILGLAVIVYDDSLMP